MFICTRNIFIFVSLFIMFSPAVAQSRQVPYEVFFRGIRDREMLSDIISISDTHNLKDRPPASINMLKKRAEKDIEDFTRFLRSRGLFKATIDIEINDTISPAEVIFHINPGPFFIIRSVEFKIDDADSEYDLILPAPERFGFSLNRPFASRNIIESEQILIETVRRRGYPFVSINEREIMVDHSDDSIRITYMISPGPAAKFGNTVITGLESVYEDFIRKSISFERGDRFSTLPVEETYSALMALGLFSTVRIIEAEELDEEGGLTVTIEVTERKHRSVGAGIKYQTDEGPGVKFLWEHRNLLKRGEKFETLTEYSDFTLSLENRFRKPAFLRKDQTLRLSARLASDDPDAYRSKSISFTGLVERDIKKDLRAGIGISFRSADITQIASKDSFNIISLPLTLERDRRDDLLDPARGGRLSFRITPFYQPSGASLFFTKGVINYRHYFNIFKKPYSTLAGSLTVGSIKGSARGDIPADERFYSGGGGSIRGYSFQSVGPLSGNIPIGGRSLFETSMELRVRLSPQWGLVGFVDGGSAFTDNIFSSGEKLKWGTGMGIRYYTPIGPVRLDIGVPVNRREGIDKSFQIYINLGQAF